MKNIESTKLFAILIVNCIEMLLILGDVLDHVSEEGHVIVQGGQDPEIEGKNLLWFRPRNYKYLNGLFSLHQLRQI